MSVFNYHCANCNAPATKPPCVKSEEAKATLGTFSCSARCAKGKVKVKREKASAK